MIDSIDRYDARVQSAEIEEIKEKVVRIEELMEECVEILELMEDPSDDGVLQEECWG